MTKSKKRPILIGLLVILCVIFCITGFITVYQTVRGNTEEKAFDDLKKYLGTPEVSPAELTPDGGEEPQGESDEPEQAPVIERISTNGRYDELYEQNPDLFGWIIIEDTKIDYPVMHTPDDPEYYLHRSFEKKYSASGVPFLDAMCYDGCKNLILYGHHMNNGKMFAQLLKYSDEEFWQEHKTVIFDTVEEHGEYEIFAAFRSKVYKTKEDGAFIWYNYTDLTDEYTFNEYIAGIDSVKLYDTGITAEFGDELLTLSTCAQNSRNRFVVVAKRVK